MSYQVKLGEHKYFASVERLSGNFSLFLNNQEITDTRIIDFTKNEDALFKITPTSKLGGDVKFVFSLYSEDKTQTYIDTVYYLDRGVDFTITDLPLYPTTLYHCDSNNEGTWLFHSNSFSFNIKSSSNDAFAVHIQRSAAWAFGNTQNYYIGDKSMPTNALFEFETPKFPDDVVKVNNGKTTITTGTGRYAYSPFSYKKGEQKANEFVLVYVRNSAGNWKVIKWEFSFSDPGGYNPG